MTQVTDSDAATIDIDYDDRGLPTQLSSHDGDVSYQYDAAGSRTAMQVGSGTPTTYAYDDAGRLSGIANNGVTAAFTFDASGRPVGATLPGALHRTDVLDDAGRLISRQFQTSTDMSSLDYAYDATGHRVASWGALDPMRLPAPVAASTFDAANRQLSRGTTQLSHDEAGNLTSDGTRTFTWNSRGQLGTVTHNGDETSYGYDALGRRTSVTTGQSTARATYDAWNVAQIDDSTVLSKLLSGMHLDDLLATTVDSQTSAVLTDALGTDIGTVSGTTINPGAAVDPFGNGTPAGSRWAGGTRDAAGLIDRRLRDYDPSLASFISEDPSGVNGGFNLYAYVQGDPLNRTDPTGLSFLSGALDLAGDLSVGAANGATFGAFGAVTGLHACGVAGTIGAWAGSAALAWATGGVATAGFGIARIGGAAGLIGGGAIGGMIGSASSSVATGQTPNGWTLGTGALAGAAPGLIHAVGAGPAKGTFIDNWRVTPVMPGTVMMADEFNTLYGPGSGGGRKC